MELIAEFTDWPIVTITTIWHGSKVMVMAEVVEEGRTLRLRQLHIVADAKNKLGVAGLRELVRSVMEQWNYDEIIIVGGDRTTGANPGRTPGILRFSRHSGDP